MNVQFESCRICFQREIHVMRRALMPCHGVRMVGGVQILECKPYALRVGGAPCVGGKCEAVHMDGVVQGRLRCLVRRLPSGRRRWHLRAANLRAETCACSADMSGMSTCMDGMQQTACHEHV